MITPEELAADKALCEAATPGPWKAYANLGCKRIAGPKHGVRQTHRQTLADTVGLRNEAEDRANAVLMAAARERLPAYIAEVERLQAQLKEKAHG